MPQQINDWEPVKSNDPGDWEPVQPSKINDWEPFVGPMEPTRQPTWTQSAISHGLGILPTVAGSIGGSIIEPGLGTAAGGALGAGIGDYLKQQYEISQHLRDEYKPAVTAVAAGLGAIPFAGEAPGAGATVSELGKYAMRAPISHAIQGAVVGGGATVPQHIAETGNFELPSAREVGSGVLGGAITGGIGGAAFGSLPAYMRARNIFENGASAGTPNMSVSAEPIPSEPIMAQPRQLTGRVEPVASPRPEPPPRTPPPVDIPVEEGKDLVFPIAKPTEAQLDNLMKEGYVFRGTTPDGKSSIFKFVKDLVQNEEGTLDVGQLTQGIKRVFQGPTEEEGVPNVRMQSQLENISNAPRSEPLSFAPPLQRELQLPQTEPQFDEPSFAKVKGGGLAVDVDVPRAAENLTKDYSSPLPGIMMREGIQNALDAADKMGEDGHVRVRVQDDPSHTIEIHDNGHGLDETGLAEKLVRLFATGKSGDEGATGGKGIGSASYVLGGKDFRIETVSVDQTDGKKYKIEAGGSPDQFLDSSKGSDWNKVEVPHSTPTGTTIKVALKEGQDVYDSRRMIDKIIQHTRDRTSKLTYDPYGIMSRGKHVSKIESMGFNKSGQPEEHAFNPTSNDKLIGDFTVNNSDVKVQVPPFDENQERQSINIHYLNNGMYQFSENKWLNEKAKGIPENVVVNIHPLVDEMHNDYPFINTREDMKKDIKEIIGKYIDEHVTGPAVERKKNRVQELYDSMSPVEVPGLKRKAVIFDPGNRLTPDELKIFTESPIIKQLLQHYDRLIDSILTSVDNLKWADRLEAVGLVLDPNMNGVHIPNPATKKSTILINPFARMEYTNPKDNAWKNTITNMHEVAHIGDEAGTPFQLHPEDLKDPRVGEYLSSYMEQLVQHGDIGYSNTGHGMGFVHRLGWVYAKFGVDNAYTAAKQLESIFRGKGQTGGYSPAVQGLLQIYTDSRGRDAATEDLLSGTGVKQANQRSGGTGNIPSNNQTDGNGIPLPKKKSTLREAYNLSRGMTTTMDLSAPFRQGLPLIGTRSWWTSWKQQVQALGSEAAYAKTLADIKKRPLFTRRVNTATGKITKSFAEQAGLAITDVGTSLNQREEAIASNWVESGAMFGKDNAVHRGYQKTFGRAARASNRAYTAYLNQLRADTFENLIKASVDQADPRKPDTNPITNMVYAREIAEVVNTLTGRGSLTLAGPSHEGGKWHLKRHSAEAAAPFLTNALFAPRNTSAKMNMLNPFTYMMASPNVRKQYLKGLISVAGAWLTVAGLAKLAGANVSLDTNSADFGKVRIGNFRLDPAGGFQQFLVAFSRLVTGHESSSATGRDFQLGQGYRADTRWSVAERFAINKLHPVVKFSHDILDASQRKPFGVGDAILQQATPLVVGDLMDMMKEDPRLLPLSPLVIGGMGTQVYDKGQDPGKYLPRKYDYTFTGGGF